ncbi:MAG TPA: radical SAM protein [Chitinispirillaceae bacterium]|nr:radical SAM protein [Chitinispirillaceae bacterium]
MSKLLYLVNPRADIECYFGTDVFRTAASEPVAYFTDLATTTIASMAKPYLDVKICEEEASSVDFEIDADFIGITGKISQRKGMVRIAEEFRKRGKVIIIGGPYATLNPESVRPYCDILVHGELENVSSELFSDIVNDSWKDEYFGTPSDLSNTPVPDLSLYPNGRTVSGAIQISRGCPFNCDFCEVVQYLGKKQRYKPVENVIKELDNIYASGYTDVFISDDNLIGNGKKAKEVLGAIIEWNKLGKKRKVSFTVQVSVNVADDDELLNLIAQASIDLAFVGLETVNVESLKSAGKQHNLIDMKAKIHKLVNFGIQPLSGIMVGFDFDTVSTFREIRDFFALLPIPIYTIQSLIAFSTTPLYKRLKAEGRINADASTDAYLIPTNTNVIPKLMSSKELEDGVKWLSSNLYHPYIYEQRVSKMLQELNYETRPWYLEGYTSPNYEREDRKWFSEQSLKTIGYLYNMGEDERKMVLNLQKISESYPYKTPLVTTYLVRYSQIRYFFNRLGIYDPALVEL